MNKINVRNGIIVAIILAAALSRLISPYNFSPLVAIALFGGAQFQKKWQAYLIPLAAYFISDVALQATGLMGAYSFSQSFVLISQVFVYAGMVLVTALGSTLRQPKALKVLGYSLTGSAIFWIVSNFGVWFANHFAAGTAAYEPGLTLGFTYLRALPFYNELSTRLFANAFGGDLLYTGLLFGVFALVQKKSPALRYSH